MGDGFLSYFRIFLTSITLIFLSCTSTAADSDSRANQGQKASSEKVVALIGDSMTWIGGYDCEKERGWNHYFRQAFPSYSIDVYARSGATWTNTPHTRGDTDFYSELLDDENVVYDQVKRLIDATQKDNSKSPDLIIIFAGANDALFGNKRPGLYENGNPLPEGDLDNVKPSEVTTLSRSVELGCRLLRQHLEDARIILVTPTQMAKASPENTRKVSEIIEKTGRHLGIQVLRADQDVDIRHETEKQKKHKYTYDGIHTNADGAKLIAEYIVEKVRGL